MSVIPPDAGPRSHRAATVAARVLLVPYLVALLLVVWLPADEASKATGVVFWLARELSAHLGTAPGTTAAIFEFAANVVLFAPLGLLLMIGWRHSARLVVLAGFAASATIELVQMLIPSRFPSLSDVVANTLGTAIGCLIARMLVRRHPRDDEGVGRCETSQP